MTRPIPRNLVSRIRKLLRLPEEVPTSQQAISITRLTVLKSLCQEPDVANRFAIYLARRTLERVKQGEGRSKHDGTPTDLVRQSLMAEILSDMNEWQKRPTKEQREKLRNLLNRIRTEQNEYENQRWGPVRLIDDWDLLLFEYALSCLVGPEDECGHWAYQTARHYAERYSSSQGTGLIAASVPLVQDIADFWAREYDLTAEATPSPSKTAKRRHRKSAKSGRSKRAEFTPRQGQFLAFIDLYWKLHRRGPSEAELVQFFGVTPPSVHSMIVRLEELGLISRQAGEARSVRVTVPAKQLPALDDVAG